MPRNKMAARCHGNPAATLLISNWFIGSLFQIIPNDLQEHHMENPIKSNSQTEFWINCKLSGKTGGLNTKSRSSFTGTDHGRHATRSNCQCIGVGSSRHRILPPPEEKWLVALHFHTQLKPDQITKHVNYWTLGRCEPLRGRTSTESIDSRRHLFASHLVTSAPAGMFQMECQGFLGPVRQRESLSLSSSDGHHWHGKKRKGKKKK